MRFAPAGMAGFRGRAAPTGARPDVALPLHISGTLMILVSRAGPLLLLVTTLIAGCAGRGTVSSTSPPAVSQPVEDADTLARAGRYAAARERYTTVLAAGRDAPDADRALLGLARLALAPDNSERDERAAAAYLDRLIGEYPNSAWALEARTWREVLGTTSRLRQLVRRQQQELEGLRRNLRQEQKEAVRLRQERERLRQIDAELERPILLAPQSSSGPARILQE
jgi:hypothetical protein